MRIRIYKGSRLKISFGAFGVTLGEGFRLSDPSSDAFWSGMSILPDLPKNLQYANS